LRKNYKITFVKNNPVLFCSKTIPEEMEIYKPDSVTPKGSLSFI